MHWEPHREDPEVTTPKQSLLWAISNSEWVSANLKCNTKFLESCGNKFMELQGNFMTINVKALTLPLWSRAPSAPSCRHNVEAGQHHSPSSLFPQLPYSVLILIPWNYVFFSYNSHLKSLILNHIAFSEFQLPVLISLQQIIFYHPTHSPQLIFASILVKFHSSLTFLSYWSIGVFKSLAPLFLMIYTY